MTDYPSAAGPACAFDACRGGRECQHTGMHQAVSVEHQCRVRENLTGAERQQVGSAGTGTDKVDNTRTRGRHRAFLRVGWRTMSSER